MICGNILRYIAYAILLTCENVCDIDIAYSNIAILPNPTCSVLKCTYVSVCIVLCTYYIIIQYIYIHVRTYIYGYVMVIRLVRFRLIVKWGDH